MSEEDVEDLLPPVDFPKIYPLKGRMWEAAVKGLRRTNSKKSSFAMAGQVTAVDKEMDIYELAETIISSISENLDVDHVDEFIFRIVSFEESKEVTGDDDDDTLQAH